MKGLDAIFGVVIIIIGITTIILMLSTFSASASYLVVKNNHLRGCLK